MINETRDWDDVWNSSLWLDGSTLWTLMLAGSNDNQVTNGTIRELFIETYATTETPTGQPTSASPTASPTTADFGPIDFEVNSTMNFSDESMDIGWITFGSCTYGSGDLLAYNSDFTYSELLDLARYAVTVMIGPSTNVPGVSMDADLTNTADLCSNPV